MQPLLTAFRPLSDHFYQILEDEYFREYPRMMPFNELPRPKPKPASSSSSKSEFIDWDWSSNEFCKMIRTGHNHS